MKNIIQIFSLLVIVLFITACSSKQNFTSSEDKPIVTNDIENSIEGRYNCIYHYSTDGYSNYSENLSSKFSKKGDESSGYDNCETIEFIKLSKGIIKTIIKDEKNKFIGSQLLLEGKDYLVKDNSLVFVKKDGVSIHYLAGYEYNANVLYVNKNGDIILKNNSQGTGLAFLIIPVSSSFESWVKFTKIQ